MRGAAAAAAAAERTIIPSAAAVAAARHLENWGLALLGSPAAAATEYPVGVAVSSHNRDLRVVIGGRRGSD